MAETLAVRQKRKATRRGRDDDGENACFTGATKDFTSRLLFSRSLLRERASVEQRRLTRGRRGDPSRRVAILSSLFPKTKRAFQRRENAPFFHRFCYYSWYNVPVCDSPQPLIYTRISKMNPTSGASHLRE